MKTRLMECLNAYFERLHARQRRSWQRTRRLGRTRFILLGILSFWLLIAAFFFLGNWLFLCAFYKPLTLPHHSWAKVLAIVLAGTIGIYFAKIYGWRVNERIYGDQKQK